MSLESDINGMTEKSWVRIEKGRKIFLVSSDIFETCQVKKDVLEFRRMLLHVVIFLEGKDMKLLSNI